VRRTRHAVLELILSEHDGDCYACVRSGDCELRKLALDLHVVDISYEGERTRKMVDTSTPALVRDTGKCVGCRRCVTPATRSRSRRAVRPEPRVHHSHRPGVRERPRRRGVRAVRPVCRRVPGGGHHREHGRRPGVGGPGRPHQACDRADRARHPRRAGEEFGYEPGTLVTGKMVSALRRLGFDAVFDTNFTADLTIMEEGTELLTRLKKTLVDGEKVALPMFTSCSPGWINYMEHFNPDCWPTCPPANHPADVRGLGQDLLRRQAGQGS